MDSSEELLRFLYLCPVGVAELDGEGVIRMLNAVGSRWLMPLAIGGTLGNLFHLLAPFDTKLLDVVRKNTEGAGEICSGHRVVVRHGAGYMHLDFTVIRLDIDRLMVAFNDVTAVVDAENSVRIALETQSRQAGKLEMASGLLHDVGNAVTGLGARSARLNADNGRPELVQLGRLGGLLEQECAAINAALGPGKGAAMVHFVEQLREALTRRFDDWEDSARLFAQTVAHIQEILNIQRTYAGFGGVRGSDVVLSDVIDDVLSMQSGSLGKRHIVVTRALDPDLPPVHGDRTKLVQVLLNIVKNACESFDEQNSPLSNRSLCIEAQGLQTAVHLSVRDNGCGFDSPGLQPMPPRGVSHKPGGSGLGLVGAKTLVERHGGSLVIMSLGRGQGTTVHLELPIRKASMP